ncbi:hypothetical protein ACIRP7_20640 [Streptomyces sp. NPDC102270]|uniref:hypothetical protein n=1 Tax=Streptomyces sp. NPDC102270 TaxID=3366150 RepID=UPI003807BB9F
MGWVIAGMVVLMACGGSSGGPSGSGSATPSTGAPTSESGAPRTTPAASPSVSPTASPTGRSPSASASAPSSPKTCATGHVDVTVSPDDPPRQQVCVRPGTTVSLVLRPRTDGKRWTAVRSSARVFVLPSGWQLDADGTARASLRCAGTRGGAADITALAKEPDLAGTGSVAFTLQVNVVPHTTAG